MKSLLSFYLFFLLAPFVSAQSAISTKGDCSPIILNTRGNISITCNDVNIEAKIQDYLKKEKIIQDYNQYKQQMTILNQEIQEIKDQIEFYRNQRQADPNTINELEKSLSNNEKVLSNTYFKSEALNKKIAEQLAIVMSGIDVKFRDMEEIFKKQLDAESKRLFDSLDIRISRIERWMEGDSKDFLVFIGATGGSVKLDGDWERKYGIEFDLYLPLNSILTIKRSSVFLEYFRLDWEKTLTFPTLPGAPEQEFDEDNQSWYLAAGLKVFVYDISKIAPVYTGVFGGLSTDGAEDSFYYGLMLGSEYYFKTTRLRLNIELRWETYTNIKEKTYEFNPFGSADTDSAFSDKNGFYIGGKVLFGVNL